MYGLFDEKLKKADSELITELCKYFLQLCVSTQTSADVETF